MLSVVSHREVNSHGKVLAAPRKTQQTGGVPGAKEIVEMYHKAGNKLGVPDMRRFMKTMVAEIFYEDKYSAIHKCRGIWKQEPHDWDKTIPFCDPNNAENPEISKTKKPSKKILTTMMKYLITKYEESQSLKKLVTMSLEEPERTTYGGKPLVQSSDWQERQQQQQQQQQNPSEEVFCKSEDMLPEVKQLLPGLANTWPRTWPTIETNGAEVVEESSSHPDNFEGFDLLDFTLSTGCQEVAEEMGGVGAELNCNVQPRQNDGTQIARQVPPLSMQNYEPTGELPPPNNQVQGMSVSNGGVLQSSLTSAAAVSSGGDAQADESALADFDDFSGLIAEDVSANQYTDIDSLIKDLDPSLIQPYMGSFQPQMENIQPMMESYQPQMENIQPMMESYQPQMENTQPMMETYQPQMERTQPVMESDQPQMGSYLPHGMERNGPMEEVCALVIPTVIPTVVEDFDEPME